MSACRGRVFRAFRTVRIYINVYNVCSRAGTVKYYLIFSNFTAHIIQDDRYKHNTAYQSLSGVEYTVLYATT